ncbi:hypothetical protein Sinac_5529 [Singulisphaera acidiphila DSM 18658]|uniref:Uncharacterized protein n=1 Tax=Singulisphaera acidiphila (strain ATCC BAA-1392 / DSM 18658 / VKM B-2454 / MOB10) TaxID=886293 RepID=L0DJU9_SINAD|nr:hypothetical protein Sinac_5529 [Singulisphaera acidiphila DSM 18658]
MVLGDAETRLTESPKRRLAESLGHSESGDVAAARLRIAHLALTSRIRF